MLNLSSFSTSPLVFTLFILLFLVIILIMVALHEAGHMMAAKMFKIPVKEFSVGVGKKIWTKKKGETEYNLRMLPLGGFVRIEDPVEEDEDGNKRTVEERSLLSHISPWKRIVVFFAGPLVNLVLAFVILVPSVMSFEVVPHPSTSVKSVNECVLETDVCPAQDAGILPGDRLVSINGQSIDDYESIDEAKQKSDHLNIVIDRNGETVNKSVTLDDSKMIGIVMDTENKKATFEEANTAFVNMNTLVFQSIASLPERLFPAVMDKVTGKEPALDAPGSIVKAGRTYGEIGITEGITGEDKLFQIILMTSGLNLSLGLFNLIPLLPLDGGRIMVAFIDVFRGLWSKITRWKYSPLSYKAFSIMTWICIIPIGVAFVTLIIADIMEIIWDIVRAF